MTGADWLAALVDLAADGRTEVAAMPGVVGVELFASRDEAMRRLRLTVAPLVAGTAAGRARPTVNLV